jgi:glycosyltransferase involved in cell wall biosynthesis
MADAIAADSHNTKKDIIRFYGIPEERIRVVQLGVAEQFLQAAGSPAERLIPHRYFFSVTTHPTRKNVLGVLKAFATFAAQSQVKYVIAGVINEQQRQELFACADRLGVRDKVVLFGYADDNQLTNLYRNAEFLAYPSFYEGFGLPVVEAMACGCPVIVSNASSLPELMPDGEWLVDPYNPADMAARMQHMLALPSDQRHGIIEKNQKHARNFMWDKTAYGMIKIFEELGRDRSKRPLESGG